MEILKPFEELGKPDPRNTLFHTYDEEFNGFRPLKAKDIYEIAKPIALHDGVPKNIRSNFGIALNLYIYSWFYYPFNSEAGFLALRTTEQALKIRLGFEKKRIGLRSLTKKAIEQDLLSAEKYTRPVLSAEKSKVLEEISEISLKQSNKFPLERLPDMLAGLRNSPAHGEECIHHMGAMMLQLAADTINQLFKNSDEEETEEDS